MHLQGIKIRFVAAGPAAAHCLAGDMEGKLYTWGRNEVNFSNLLGPKIQLVWRVGLPLILD